MNKLHGAAQQGETVSETVEKSAVNGIRVVLGISGVLAIITGILILVWPGRTAMVVAAIVAAYAIISGIAYAGLGVFSKQKGGWARVGHVLLGAVFIAAGIVALLNLGATAVTLAVFTGILVGIMWIVEGVVALSTLGAGGRSKGWTIFYAIVSLIAGIALLFTPLLGAVLLWWMLGFSAIILGAVQVGRAFSFGK